MSTTARGQFEIRSWDENTDSEYGKAGKLTRARVTQSFSGDIRGEGSVEYLMTYLDESTASFIGRQLIHGELGRRSGSFVLQLDGTFDGKQAEAAWSIVPGSGTGDLRGIRGDGEFSAPLGQTATYTLDYTIE